MTTTGLTARQRRGLTLGVSLAPAVLLLGALFCLPLLRLALLSVLDEFPTPTTRFTLENYLEVVTRAFHVESIITSLKLSLIVTLATALLGYPIAYYLVRATSRAKSLILLAIISPLLISIVVRSLGWLILLGQEGVLNQVMRFLRIIDQPVQLLYNFPAVVVGEIHILLPFMVLSLTTALGQIPPSLEEGASILGAGPVRRFLQITLPLSAPGLISGIVLVFVLTMGSYVTPQMLGGGKVNVVTTDIYSTMMVDFDWPLGASLSIITLSLTLTAVIAANRLQSRMLGGAVR